MYVTVLCRWQMDLMGVEKLCAQDLYLKMFLEELQKSL